MLLNSAIYANVLGLMYIYLSFYVIGHRRKAKVLLGDGENGDLARACRVHGNFSEYVPIALILLCIVEINTTESWPVHIAGILLLLGRVLHAVGLGKTEAVSKGRVFGMLLTFASLVFSSVFNLFVVLGVYK